MTEISKMKNTFQKFENLLNGFLGSNLNVVNLNKSAPKDYRYMDYSRKGVLHDFVRIYDNRKNRFVFLFTGDLKDPINLEVKFVSNDNNTDYINFNVFKVKFKAYLKFLGDIKELDQPLPEDSKLLKKFFGDVELVKNELPTKLIDELNETVKLSQSNDNLVKELYTNGSKEISMSDEYKKVDKLKYQLHKALSELKMLSDLKYEKYNTAKVEGNKIQILKNKQLFKLKGELRDMGYNRFKVEEILNKEII